MRDNKLNHKLLLNKILDLQGVGVIWARRVRTLIITGFGNIIKFWIALDIFFILKFYE